MDMSVQEFSIRTGLPSTTLRFYDRKNILSARKRLDNGYRVYTEDQIAIALMIHSLRQAGVSLTDIKRFMASDEKTKKQLLSQWHQDLENKVALMRSAAQYLGGLQSTKQKVYLQTWDEPAAMVWFGHSVARRTHPFAECMVQDARIVKQWGIEPSDECFVRVLQARSDRMEGEVGFRLNRKVLNKVPNTAVIELVEPTLFAFIECTIDDASECVRVLRMLDRYGFLPIGRALNRYIHNDASSYRLMIPIGAVGRS